MVWQSVGNISALNLLPEIKRVSLLPYCHELLRHPQGPPIRPRSPSNCFERLAAKKTQVRNGARYQLRTRVPELHMEGIRPANSWLAFEVAAMGSGVMCVAACRTSISSIYLASANSLSVYTSASSPALEALLPRFSLTNQTHRYPVCRSASGAPSGGDIPPQSRSSRLGAGSFVVL